MAGPLLIVINCPQFGRLIPYGAHCLHRLVLASELVDGINWIQSTLLMSHVIRALKQTLLPVFFCPFLPDQTEVSRHVTRLKQAIIDEDVDLTVLSALFELLTACAVILFNSPCAQLTEEEQSQLDELFRTGLVNLFTALVAYWPCECCRQKHFGSPDPDNWMVKDDAPCGTLWNELDEEVIYTSEIILRCAFLLSTRSKKACQRLFVFHEDLARVLIQFSLSITQCRSTTLPSLTTKCVIYALRLLGRIFSASNPHRLSCSTDSNLMIQSTTRLACWLSCHMDWSLCAAEVCSTLANSVAYLTPCIVSLWGEVDKPISQSLLTRCILPSLNSSVACGEALRLICNMFTVAHHTTTVPISNLCWSHPVGRELLLRLDRFARELDTLRPYLPSPSSEPDWMLCSTRQLFKLCELFLNCAHTDKQLIDLLSSVLPTLYDFCTRLDRGTAIG
ncbi:unnamed protein product [Echinostoma caproni]|uniref:DUF2428 domain-containing protein n=1 Tax=Echinostoma caproni TaxID=27848 RepID=A0A183APK4_9TREM|nr:unnamed protein product [Echinostoma caproni]